jgi:hypothetical protein
MRATECGSRKDGNEEIDDENRRTIQWDSIRDRPSQTEMRRNAPNGQRGTCGSQRKANEGIGKENRKVIQRNPIDRGEDVAQCTGRESRGHATQEYAIAGRRHQRNGRRETKHVR